VFRCVGDGINHAIAKELPGDRAGPRILLLFQKSGKFPLGACTNIYVGTSNKRARNFHLKFLTEEGCIDQNMVVQFVIILS